MSQNIAVIFDVDGVLVDSYHAHYESWRLYGLECGFTMTREYFLTTFGRTSREVLQGMGRDGLLNGKQLDDQRIAEMDDRKEEIFRELLERDFPAMEGAVDLIDALHERGAALGVGSSGPPENVELVLRKLGRRDKFQAVITARHVTIGKPHPQVFLLAAEKLGALPESCVVVEDAQPGVAAAKAAGMKVIGLVSTGHHRSELAGADQIVGQLRSVSAQTILEMVSR